MPETIERAAAAAAAADSMIPTAVDGGEAEVGVHLPYLLPEAFRSHPQLVRDCAGRLGR